MAMPWKRPRLDRIQGLDVTDRPAHHGRVVPGLLFLRAKKWSVHIDIKIYVYIYMYGYDIKIYRYVIDI